MEERIKELMESQHMNQQVFADFLGISSATLSSIFSKRTKVTLNTIKAIKDKYPTLNYSWLIDGVGPMFNDTVHRQLRLRVRVRLSSILAMLMILPTLLRLHRSRLVMFLLLIPVRHRRRPLLRRHCGLPLRPLQVLPLVVSNQ